MATTKANTAIYDGVTLTAGAASNTSSVVALDDGYGAALHVKLTNGATGPTIPAQCQIQVSADNSVFYDYGRPLVGSVTANAVTSWGGIVIPIGVEFLRLVAGSNTDQNVTIDADISEVTAV